MSAGGEVDPTVEPRSMMSTSSRTQLGIVFHPIELRKLTGAPDPNLGLGVTRHWHENPGAGRTKGQSHD